MGDQNTYRPGLNYIELANQFWRLNEEYMFSGNETRLYFFLVHLCNTYNWQNPFKQSQRQLSGKAGLSVNSVKSAQKRLIEAGLIQVKQGTSGNPRDIKNKTEYQLLIVSKYNSHPDGHLDSQSDSDPDTIIKPKPKPKLKKKKELLIEVDESILDTQSKEYLKIALAFHKLIRDNLVRFNLSTKHVDQAKYDDWTKPIKMLVEKDQKSEDDIREVWHVLEQDPFYQQNVQKTEKLRVKQNSTGQSWFDSMLYKSRNGNKKRTSNSRGAETARTVENIIARIEQTQS
ncbi:helix-turn-helix domain-containing protein [Draconibacterium sediminis]|uniref:helix-turn-helix domain-containing protein n=1 Tax=Draconibacterium sediminis TaxID=1544798 RepID=UPI00069870F8|nr:helix-turn-helix domain-containing protein [Draconibacterium sediminis]